MKTHAVITLALVSLIGSVSADTGIVKGDRLNIRAQAKANAEVIIQVNKGDRLAIIDRNTVPYGQRSMTWLKVALPATATVWVKGEYVKDGVVTANKLNVRSGAGVNFSIVGIAQRGDKVEILRTVNDWHEIRPLASCHGWVSSDYLDIVPDLAPPPPAETIQPTLPPVGKQTTPPPPARQETKTPVLVAGQDKAAVTTRQPGTTAAETVTNAPASAPTIPAGPGKAVTREGVIISMEGYAIPRPGTHALWQETMGSKEIIAYLKSPTIPLKGYEGAKVQVIGIETALLNWKNPIIEVQQVNPTW